jgi:DNA-binding PucR family transcriptional regulator
LEGDGGNGERLRQTLHAYIDASGHISSTAAALGVSRRTVSNRLAQAEERLGRPLAACTPDLEAALLMDRALPSGK